MHYQYSITFKLKHPEFWAEDFFLAEFVFKEPQLHLLFVDVRISDIRDPSGSTRKLLEMINNFSRVKIQSQPRKISMLSIYQQQTL